MTTWAASQDDGLWGRVRMTVAGGGSRAFERSQGNYGDSDSSSQNDGVRLDGLNAISTLRSFILKRHSELSSESL